MSTLRELRRGAARNRYDQSVCTDLSVNIVRAHSAAYEAEFAAADSRTPWAAILIVSALVAFYFTVILTALLAGQPAPTAPTNGTTTESVAPSTTISGVGP